MKLNILTFGIARDIVGGNEFEVEIAQGANIADLKSYLTNAYPEFARLASFAIAVDEAYRADDFVLEQGSEVVIIPPVSGG
ncbi:MAG: MoaD/ThiS family protein [Bacteroidetes bacterium]|nr:MAG: MoaD/ThiS family protein [Bacteroidota bacterium]